MASSGAATTDPEATGTTDQGSPDPGTAGTTRGSSDSPDSDGDNRGDASGHVDGAAGGANAESALSLLPRVVAAPGEATGLALGVTSYLPQVVLIEL